MEIKNTIMRNALILLVTVFTFFSCENSDEPIIKLDNLLIGDWSNAVYDGESITFERVADLPSDAYGVSFKNEDVYIERSSGWCGTPPLIFYNSEGTWQTPETSLIEIYSQNFPGNFNWRIISLTEEKLVVKRELSDQEKEHRALIDLFYEIENLTYSVSCINSANWKFTAYGAKACGGPRGYIPYSINIDEAIFLQKVAEYTEAEHQFNIKWGVISTCDIPAQPTGIDCKNGYPVLIY
jgi:hypothetical protein